MKLKLTHHNHVPSKSIVQMIETELKALEPSLKIDEARVHLARNHEESPPFNVAFHLVAPGPDVIVKSNDHTLRAAILKALRRIAGKIGHRHAKRAQNKTKVHITSSNRRLTA